MRSPRRKRVHNVNGDRIGHHLSCTTSCAKRNLSRSLASSDSMAALLAASSAFRSVQSITCWSLSLSLSLRSVVDEIVLNCYLIFKGLVVRPLMAVVSLTSLSCGLFFACPNILIPKTNHVHDLHGCVRLASQQHGLR